jgi:hypothetical protein
MVTEQVKIAFAIALSIISVPFYPVLAQQQSGILENQNQVNASRDRPPKGTATEGGGLGDSSASCNNTGQRLTALVPRNLEQRLTTEEYPTFWFYLPYSSQEIESIEFSLHERDEKLIYRTSFKPSKTPGIIGIRLPAVPKYALQPNQYYHWYLVIKCQQKTPNQRVAVDEWVQRVPLTPESEVKMNAGNPEIWYDALSRLAEQRLSNSENEQLKRDWMNLLTSAELDSTDLEAMGKIPVVEVIQLVDNG